jgi:hypothetical protein
MAFVEQKEHKIDTRKRVSATHTMGCFVYLSLHRVGSSNASNGVWKPDPRIEASHVGR